MEAAELEAAVESIKKPIRPKRRGGRQWEWKWKIHIPCPNEFKLRFIVAARERNMSEAELGLRLLNAVLDDAAVMDAALHVPEEEIFPRVFNPPADDEPQREDSAG